MTKKHFTLAMGLMLTASITLNIWQLREANHENTYKVKACYYLIKRDKAKENWERIQYQQELNNTLYDWFGGSEYVGN